MTSEECHVRARECAANAGLAADDAVASEFIKMAAQWRAMAERQIYLGPVDLPVHPQDPAPRFLA